MKRANKESLVMGYEELSSVAIKPISDLFGSHKTGVLMDINVETITKVLGFAPNFADDPYKVENSWAFEYKGHRCAIWDYKGSHLHGQFSTFGPNEVFKELFEAHYV